MLSTRFVYGYMASVKDHTARERKPATVTTWDTLYDYQQGMFYMLHPTVVEHWNEKYIFESPRWIDPTTHRTKRGRSTTALQYALPRSYISLYHVAISRSTRERDVAQR